MILLQVHQLNNFYVLYNAVFSVLTSIPSCGRRARCLNIDRDCTIRLDSYAVESNGEVRIHLYHVSLMFLEYSVMCIAIFM